MHLSLIQLIVSIYEDPEINVAQAQLLLTTHNPLLGENQIIDKDNFFMHQNQDFNNINKMNTLVKRTEDKNKILKSKNYYNDIFWHRKDLDAPSTLSNTAINQIIDSIQRGTNWQEH